MQKIFLAFPGYQVTIDKKIKKIGNFEFWNLEKINEDEFISLIQKKIKPLNKNFKRNYFHGRSEQDYRESYRSSSWGMLLPNYVENHLDGRFESLFTVNLFSQYSLPVMFYVSSIGVSVEKDKILLAEKAQFHSEDKKFINKKFINFYNKLFPTLIGCRWEAGEVLKWSREDWRLYISRLLFERLAKYQKSKQIMTWQSECAEIVSFYEAILPRYPKDNGSYRIIQKIEILLGKSLKHNFPLVKNGLKELFASRNEFVHGSFFDRLKKNTKVYPDNNLAQLPSVDFNFLQAQADLAKKVFIVFLYLKKLKQRKSLRNTIPEIIHSGIMDIDIRKKIQNHSEEILKLLSF